jgi:transposase
MAGANSKYRVVLSQETRQRLELITRNGSSPAKKILHARVLLMSDSEHPAGRYHDREIAGALGVHVNTVARIRKRFVLQGEGPALNRKPRPTPPTPPKLDGRAEAILVAICCSPPPEGRTRWTLTLLQEEMVGRRVVSSICCETIRKTLKKMCCNLGGSSDSVSPNVTQPGLSHRWSRSWTSMPRRRTTRSH